MKKILDKCKNFLSSDKLNNFFVISIFVLVIFLLTLKFIIIPANAADEPSDGGGSVQITDLTNTIWYLDARQIPEQYIEFNINFSSNGQSFVTLRTEADRYKGWTIYYDNTSVYTHINGWVEGYQEISITGGLDIENLDLVQWLDNIGTQLKVTDLTDTTWNVPAGWAAESGYGEFNVTGVCIHNSYEDSLSPLYIGYYIDASSFDFAVRANSIICNSNPDAIVSTNSFTLSITGGTDATNTVLIAWLSKYGELQGGVEPEPEPITGWANNETINFLITPIVQTTPPDVNDYQTIYYYPGWEKAYAILRDVPTVDGDSFSTFVLYYDTYYEALYYGIDYYERSILTEDVYNDGYDNGYNEGYYNGLSIGESSALGQNLLGDILSAPIRALDNLVIIDTPSGFSISVWNIFSALIGVGLFIWFLKMFAGG